MNDETASIEKSRGFPPVVGERPRVLVLGSLPGRASLQAAEYYRQPRNAFWRIMGALCDAEPELPYSDRLLALKRAGVALWDVLQEAARPGSLDSSIVTSTQRTNNIGELIACHRSITLLAFNGKKAAEIFSRHIEASLPRRDLTLVTLPSTSPAYASLQQEKKLAMWQAALIPHLRAAKA